MGLLDDTDDNEDGDVVTDDDDDDDVVVTVGTVSDEGDRGIISAYWLCL